MISSCSRVILVSISATGVLAAPPSFTPLGDLAGGSFSSRANGISADGSGIVGESHGSDGLHAVVWRDGGMIDLGPGRANAVTSNGSGVVRRADDAGGGFATHWNYRMPPVQPAYSGSTFEFTQSEALGVSAHGEVMVGWRLEGGRERAFWYGTGLDFSLPPSSVGYIPRAASAVGGPVVGYSSVGRESPQRDALLVFDGYG